MPMNHRFWRGERGKNRTLLRDVLLPYAGGEWLVQLNLKMGRKRGGKRGILIANQEPYSLTQIEGGKDKPVGEERRSKVPSISVKKRVFIFVEWGRQNVDDRGEERRERGISSLSGHAAMTRQLFRQCGRRLHRGRGKRNS